MPRLSAQPKTTSRRHRSGQAILELVVGLIAMVVLFMGMLQIQALARAHTRALSGAREEAGADAIAGSYMLRHGQPRFIQDWQAGPDQARYSQDDVAQPANPGGSVQGIVRYAHPADLRVYVPTNPVSDMADSGRVLTDMYLTHGHEASDSIPLYPIIRSLVYGASDIQMQGNAWLTWTHIE